MKNKVVIFDRYHEEALSLLKKNKIDFTHYESAQPSGICEEAEVISIRSRTIINRESLNLFPQLKYIVTATSGFDHIDLLATKKQNISVEYCPEANFVSAAELTWALILSLSRFLPLADRNTKNMQWRNSMPIGREISQKNLLIIGYGRIGKLVSEYAKAFRLNIFIYDPYKEEQNIESLETCVENMDIITCHVPKTKKTLGMLNRSFFSLMKKNAIFINTSRGDVVVEEDLKEAIETKHLRVALDVFQTEPLTKDHFLLKQNDCILSPHMGAYTEEALYKASMASAQKIINYYANVNLTNPLPPLDCWAKDI